MDNHVKEALRMLRLLLAFSIFICSAGSVFADVTLKQLFSNEQRALNAIPDARIATLFERSKQAKHSLKDVTYTKGWLAAQPDATGGAEWQCLAEALYFEARGESVRGQFAVAEVILNRVSSTRYPDTICEVINQGTGRKHACQFSYTCDGHAEVVSEPLAYEQVAKIAALSMKASERPLTQGATHYHTKAVSPHWARKFPRTTTIGFHHFYRQPTRLSKK
ncbi:cell wall hydrolase [uncultured Lentibacter sp.]|uniref:cell wall hydrolase n=1 Tax=uncultured Lentibacter sp. TaxID=1659309 RepID=UPI00261B8D81|nr:cell wall hydrolase [uncultured Lentibacter sp.]